MQLEIVFRSLSTRTLHRTEFVRFVKRGEKGIFVLAPMIGKKRREEEATADSDSKSDGEARLYGFRSVYVFDYLVICGRDSAHSMDSACAT